MDNPLINQPTGAERPASNGLSTPSAQQLVQRLEIPKAERFRTSKTFAIAKLALGSLNLIFAIIAFGLSIGLVLGSDIQFSPRLAFFYLSLTALSIIWQLAQYITLALRREWRSICSVAHEVMHLILSFFAVAVVFFQCLILASQVPNYTIKENCAYDWKSFEHCDFLSFPSQDVADRYFGMMETLAAFGVLLLLLHVTLLVMACVETGRRRAYEKKIKTMYLMPAPGPADGRMYYTPLHH